MTPAVVSVLTNGLTCGQTTACQGGTLITAGPFYIWCQMVPPPVPDPGGGGATISNGWAAPIHAQPTGPTPIRNNSIHNPNNQTLVGNPYQHLGNKSPVVITFKLGNIEREKIYMVDNNKREVIIKVGNIIHKIEAKVSVTISSLRRTTGNIKIKILNSRMFRSKNSD